MVPKAGVNAPGQGRTSTAKQICAPTKKGPKIGALCLRWCRRRDLNPHEHSSLPPQDSVSTNSTTSAILLSVQFRQVVVDWIKRHPVEDERNSDAFKDLAKGAHRDSDPLYQFLQSGGSANE